MKMRTLCGTILAAAVYCGAFAAFGDSLGNIGDVRLKGRLGERLDVMIEKHVAARDVDYITAPFMEKTETKGKACHCFCLTGSLQNFSVRAIGHSAGIGRFLRSNVLAIALPRISMLYSNNDLSFQMS